ncbi:MAG: GNAT family N-acetyltransferase, partial [Gimesia sp.]
GLAVHPDFQQRGIAGCMLEEIMVRAHNIGKNFVVLNTIRETENVPLFQKMGFRVVHEAIATWCTSEFHPLLHDVKMERKVVKN